MSYRSNLESFLSVITGRTFIKSNVFADELKTLFIHFYNSYEEFLEENQDTPVTKDQYLSYFGTFDKIEKWIVFEPTRIFRDFKDVDNIEVTLAFEGKVYHATINRNDLNNYLGFDVTILSPDNASWNTQFSDVYGYGLKNEKRKEMFEQFTKVSEL
ncbi:hypothetical protein ABNX05_11045 [Lysinibacillus sp. M3]|uniref:Uncharacterized protein n=1 Tax=Lysinibacillus zambalensis TaxID=3160866 RepID=A0ABV1MU67_9BACI